MFKIPRVHDNDKYVEHHSFNNLHNFRTVGDMKHSLTLDRTIKSLNLFDDIY